MNYILCVSPLHILTAIAIKQTYFQNQKMKMILLDYSAGSEEMRDKLEQSGQFDSVIYFEGAKIWHRYEEKKNKLFVFSFLMKDARYLRDQGIDIYDISGLIFPYRDPLSTLIAKELFKNKIDCTYSYYDDGCAAYANENNVGMESQYPGRMELFFKVPIRYYIPHVAYMYSPGEYKHYEYFNIKKIEIPDDRDYLRTINGLFDYVEYQERSFIFFDQCGNDQTSERYVNTDSSILQLLNESFDKTELYVKKHPKRRGKLYENDGWAIYPVKQTVPFEISVLNMKNINEVTLMSGCSAACFTPKMLFGYEPRVVFLYKVLSNMFGEENISKLDVAVESLRVLYKDKKKICVPKSKEELYECLRRKEV